MRNTSASKPLVKVRDLTMHFPIHSGLLRRRTGEVKAVDGISFDVFEGETLGLVGESGCGKSTLARLLLRLILGWRCSRQCFLRLLRISKRGA